MVFDCRLDFGDRRRGRAGVGVHLFVRRACLQIPDCEYLVSMFVNYPELKRRGFLEDKGDFYE